MDKKTLFKNKLEMEYQALMQERSGILIALTGIPITVFNVFFSLFHLAVLESVVSAFISFILILSLKYQWDGKLSLKRNEIDKLL